MALVSQRKRPHNICGIRLDYGVQIYEQYRMSPFQRLSVCSFSFLPPQSTGNPSKRIIFNALVVGQGPGRSL